KIQTDPEEIIGGHLKQQEEGYGPYHFYRAARLAEVFEGVSLVASGCNAFEIERQLTPDALSPAEAFAAWKRGELIGHTVVALRSAVAQ
ncbi:MAG: hypothetical protein LBU45_05025, partial [Azoarcus sp.]|nr:hypothetical protein [Azoarcus sp.]